MPRRHRNARTVPDGDQLAAAIGVQGDVLTMADGKYPCAGCRKRGHWNGGYCPLCKGRIVLAARRRATSGR
jgi:hypothetical protein